MATVWFALPSRSDSVMWSASSRVGRKVDVAFALLLSVLALLSGAVSVEASSADPTWDYYLASIAAADGALRLHETSTALRWLERAPVAHRGWEWRYLTASADESSFAIRPHAGAITGLAISDDGALLASTSADGTVLLTNARTGESLGELVGHTASVWSPAFRPRTHELSTIGSDGTLRRWDADTRTDIQRLEEVGRGMGAVTWSPDGTWMAVGAWTIDRDRGVVGRLQLWTYEGVSVWDVEYGVKPIVGLAFSPDGSRLAVGTWDGWIGLFEVPGDGTTIHQFEYPLLEGTYPAMQDVAFAPDGSILVSASKDGMVRTFDPARLELVRAVQAHPRWVNAIAFDARETWFVSASSDETLRLWNRDGARALRVLHGHTSAVTSVVVAADGSAIVSGDADGSIRWWSRELTRTARTTWQHASDVYGFDVSTDGTHAVSAAWGGTVKLWDVATGETIWTSPAHETSANAVAFDPTATRIVSGGNDGRVRMLDAGTGDVLATWEDIEDGRVACVAFSPDGKLVFAPTSRPHGKIWNAVTGEAMHRIEGTAGEIYAADFSGDGRNLALGWTDGRVRVIDPVSGAESLSLEAHEHGTYGIAFTPDGSRLVTCGADRSIRVWDLASASVVHELQGHSELVYDVDVDAHATRIVSASNDHTVRLWDLRSGEQVLTIPYDVQIYGVRFAPDGDTLFVLPMDGTIRVVRSSPRSGVFGSDR